MRSVSPFERYGRSTPTTDSSLQVHLFIVTDTISSVADKYYGDWRFWRLIAERNEITDVRQVAPGTQIVIPARPLEVGQYESL